MILGAALCAFGVGIILANQARLAGDIDRELQERARRSMRPGPQPPGGGGFQRGPGQGPGPGMGFGQGGGPDGPGGPNLGPGNGNGRPLNQRPFGPPSQRPAWMDSEGFMLGELRRPRVFDKELKTRSQQGDVPIDRKAVEAALTGRAVFSDAKFQDEAVRVFTEPLREGNEVVAVVQVAREKRDLERLWRSQAGTLLVFLPGVLLAAALGALFLTSRAFKPIATMRDAAGRITGENLTERIDIQGDDELADLGRNFNEMVARLERSFEELREAYENQKRFTADASHELRTPLTRLQLATSAALSNDATAQEQRHALEVANRSAGSMARLVQQLLILAKADAGQLEFRREKTDMRILASQAIESVACPWGTELVTQFSDHAVYQMVDPDAFQRVIVNLLENAFRYAPGGQVTVGVNEQGLWVSDTGPGIPPEHLPHLTERFYRVDSARSEASGGSGLGLAICRTTVEGHGWELGIESQIGKGTTVRVKFSEKTPKSANQTTSS